MYLIRFILFCTDAVNDFLSKNCPYIAGAIAFYTLFSMFPLVLLTISIWGFFLEPGVGRAQLAAELAKVIPVSKEFIGETMGGVASARQITGIASICGLALGSTAAFGTIRKGINTAWGVSRTRPFWRERGIDFGLAASAGSVMLLLLYIAPMIGTMEHFLEPVAPGVDFDLLARLISQVASPLVGFGIFLTLYRFMPNTKVTYGDVWLGALAASMAFTIATYGFIWYVNTFPVYNLVYGAIGAIMALLTWVYVSAIILLFGALATSRFAKLRYEMGGEIHGLRLLWTALTRVRVRVVRSEPYGV